MANRQPTDPRQDVTVQISDAESEPNLVMAEAPDGEQPIPEKADNAMDKSTVHEESATITPSPQDPPPSMDVSDPAATAQVTQTQVVATGEQTTSIQYPQAALSPVITTTVHHLTADPGDVVGQMDTAQTTDGLTAPDADEEMPPENTPPISRSQVVRGTNSGSFE